MRGTKAATARAARRLPCRLAAAAATVSLVALSVPAAPASALGTGSTASSPPTTPAGTPTTVTAPSTTVPPPSTTGPVPPGLPASAAYILVDADTGRILAQSDDDQPMSPASLSKMFTALVATGWLPPSATIEATVQDTTVEPNRIGMMPGQAWPLNEVLQALMLISANDAAYALAGTVAGSPAAFGPVVEKAMTEMGITDHPQFNDPAGFDDTTSIGGGNLIDVRDLAIAARAVLADNQLASIVEQRKLAFTGPQGTVYGLANVNDFFLDSYAGAVGVKTGLTDKSGFSVAEAATRSGRTMIAVVLHGTNSPQTATMLLDQGFSTPVATEPRAGQLPPVVLPEPVADPPPPTSTTTAPAPAGRVSLGPARRAVLRTGAGGGPGTGVVVAGAVAAALLAVVALLTGRRLRRRTRPAHARR